MKASKSRGQSKSLSIDEALAKIRIAADTINLRGGVKPHERKRIEEAFTILSQPSKATSAKTRERRESYRHFLRHIRNGCGPQLVVVSAVGIGQSAMTNMREDARLRLPLEIKKHENTLKSSIIHTLAEECSAKVLSSTEHTPENRTSTPQVSQQANSTAETPFAPVEQPHSKHPGSFTELSDVLGSQTSRVFELTLQDAQTIVASDLVPGKVFLMEPYGSHTLPFITITLSEELCAYFSAQRNRLM